ncbi:hypothetical protein [Actinoplanes flavus]|uniref:Uncharacterized protein n=1 Tax=Actinoplanes flavus TaxID=2820290 RepID=A0ABS3UHE9_9ACTN|nr:hypothetical protein [Actinoplanes flavus]MBO3738215.1 hypothetical protein [Actinoplanes flavus]
MPKARPRNRRAGRRVPAVKTRPSRAQGLAKPPPEPEPEPKSTGLFLLQALGWLVAAAVYLVLMAAGEITAQAYADAARWLTGGQAVGMAFAGWLISFVLFGAVWALILLRKRVARPWLFAIGGAATLLLPTIFVLFPYSGNYVADLVGGTGGAAFISGQQFGAWAGILPFLVVPFVMFSERLRDRFGEEQLKRTTTALTVLFVIVMLYLGLY